MRARTVSPGTAFSTKNTMPSSRATVLPSPEVPSTVSMISSPFCIGNNVRLLTCEHKKRLTSDSEPDRRRYSMISALAADPPKLSCRSFQLGPEFCGVVSLLRHVLKNGVGNFDSFDVDIIRVF